jgi:hypothetical protein
MKTCGEVSDDLKHAIVKKYHGKDVPTREEFMSFLKNNQDQFITNYNDEKEAINYLLDIVLSINHFKLPDGINIQTALFGEHVVNRLLTIEEYARLTTYI